MILILLIIIRYILKVYSDIIQTYITNAIYLNGVKRVSQRHESNLNPQIATLLL